MKFLGRLGPGPGTSRLDFAGYPVPDLDAGFLDPDPGIFLTDFFHEIFAGMGVAQGMVDSPRQKFHQNPFITF